MRHLLTILCLVAPVFAAAAGLEPYRDQGALDAALARWRDASQPLMRSRVLRMNAAPGGSATAMMEAAAPAAAAAPAPAGDSITNVQTAGVDEGGIVKRAGDWLVVLRRGRLFTVRVGGSDAALVRGSMIDAYAPGSDPAGTWYDELLVSGRDVVVIGFSYARGGTEIGLFELGAGGSLGYRATWHLRSNDYWSSRNYASRLIGRTLVFYTPTVLQPWGGAPAWPGMRRWQGSVPDEFERILPPTRIYRSDDDFAPGEPLALHTVTRCRIGDGGEAALRCEASAVLAPVGRVFYVSAGSVYVWTNRQRAASESLSAVFRLPLQQGAAPTMLKTSGVPVDQMSFLEDSQGQLNVLLRAAGDGEGMWGAERSRAAAFALLRVPLAAFGDGSAAAGAAHYRRLPGPRDGAVHNRFVGDWLLWGGGDRAWALRHADPRAAATALDPGHGVERIEALGADALLVGNAGSQLRFSAVALGGADARIAGRHALADMRQGETRTHGFFYRADSTDSGMLGLPVTGAPRGGGAAASVVFLRQRGLAFTAAGALEARGARIGSDNCKASCVDWYGNARPVFIGERVFALLGYELVEGSIGRDGLLQERQRLDFAPQPRLRSVRPMPFATPLAD